MANKKLAKDVAEKADRVRLKKSEAPKKASHKTTKRDNPATAKADARQKPQAQRPNRGMGSSYAYAVENVLGEASKREEGYLGVQDKLLDPKDHTDRELMYKGKGKKLDQGE